MKNRLKAYNKENLQNKKKFFKSIFFFAVFIGKLYVWRDTDSKICLGYPFHMYPWLAGCNGWEEIADFAQQKEKWLKKYLELPNGIPSSDTIRMTAGNIDTAYFYQAVIQSLEGLVNDVHAEAHSREIFSMDGKESRGSKRIQ